MNKSEYTAEDYAEYMKEYKAWESSEPEIPSYFMTDEARDAINRKYRKWKISEPKPPRFAAYELPNRKGYFAVWDSENNRFYEDEKGEIDVYTEQAAAVESIRKKKGSRIENERVS